MCAAALPVKHESWRRTDTDQSMPALVASHKKRKEQEPFTNFGEIQEFRGINVERKGRVWDALSTEPRSPHWLSLTEMRAPGNHAPDTSIHRPTSSLWGAKYAQRKKRPHKEPQEVQTQQWGR